MLLSADERDATLKQIRAAFGSRPDLPDGKEFVEEMKALWAGFAPKNG
jgi:hypothetical protein